MQHADNYENKVLKGLCTYIYCRKTCTVADIILLINTVNMHKTIISKHRKNTSFSNFRRHRLYSCLQVRGINELKNK